MTMDATARCRSGSLQCQVDVNGRHTLATDEPQSLGGDDTAPAPHELVPAAVASCIATMVTLYAAKRDWSLGDVVVNVEYDSDAVPRHCDVHVHVDGPLSHDQAQRLRRVIEGCPVRRALATGFSFDEDLVVTTPDPEVVS